MEYATITQAASGLSTSSTPVNPISNISAQLGALLSRAITESLPVAIDALDSSFNNGARSAYPRTYCDGFSTGYAAWIASESTSLRPEVAELIQGACLHTPDKPNQTMTGDFQLSLSDAMDIVVRACFAANNDPLNAAAKMPGGFHAMSYIELPGQHAFEKGKAYGAERGRQDGFADGNAAARAKQPVPAMLIYQAETIADELFK